jgi:hypothetical protein
MREDIRKDKNVQERDTMYVYAFLSLSFNLFFFIVWLFQQKKRRRFNFVLQKGNIYSTANF